jgi:hypothetical protein
LGRTTGYRVENLSQGGQRRVNSFPDGLKTEQVKDPEGTITNRFPDGSMATFAYGPDPRWGMLSPIAQTSTLATAGRLALTITKTRTVTLTDSNNPLSLAAMTDTTRLNGRAYTSTYSAATRTITNTTPEGRQSSVTLDVRGRPIRFQVAGLLPTLVSSDNYGRLATAATGVGPDTRTTTPSPITVSVTWTPSPIR